MSYRFELVTAPTQEPVSLSEAKDHLRYWDSDEDDLITGLIETARLLVESHTSRQLVTATWKLHLDGFPTGDIEIRKVPVASVSSVTYFDAEGDSQTWAADQYQTELKGYPAIIRPAYNVSYPSTRWKHPSAVTVQFVAGTSVALVDRRAKSAILILTKHLFDNRDLVGNVQLHETPFAFRALVDSLKWTVYTAC